MSRLLQFGFVGASVFVGCVTVTPFVAWVFGVVGFPEGATLGFVLWLIWVFLRKSCLDVIM